MRKGQFTNSMILVFIIVILIAYIYFVSTLNIQSNIKYLLEIVIPLFIVILFYVLVR